MFPYVVINFFLVMFRISPVKKSEKVEDLDPVQPVFVGEFPQLVRDEQAILLQKRVPGEYSWLQYFPRKSIFLMC